MHSWPDRRNLTKEVNPLEVVTMADCPAPPPPASPVPDIIIPSLTRELLQKPLEKRRVQEYLNFLNSQLASSPRPLKTGRRRNVLHELLSTCFLHDLHRGILNCESTFKVLSKVALACGATGVKIEDPRATPSPQVMLELHDRLRRWLAGGSNGVEIFLVRPCDDGKKGTDRSKLYWCRSVFDMHSGAPWGSMKLRTIKNMDLRTHGAIYLPECLFYGSPSCPATGAPDEDRTTTDVLLALTYFREVCRAVAVWAGPVDAKGMKITRGGWWTWGTEGVTQSTDINLIYSLERYLFLHNRIVGLVAPISSPRPWVMKPPSERDTPPPPEYAAAVPVSAPPHAPFAYFGHLGSSNHCRCPPLNHPGLHHRISATAVHAFLKDTFSDTFFPGKRFVDIDNDLSMVYSPEYHARAPGNPVLEGMTKGWFPTGPECVGERWEAVELEMLRHYDRSCS
ncbi:hypothetical protein BDZ91DRAFT_763093 [Kalaharituber pfeilii]|nr:hypothetical protein BDZ91DRAFT_763093 [Kalaharituber pfeilii]